MAVKSAIQISDPSLDVMAAVKNCVAFLSLLESLQSDPQFIPNLAKQINAAYALIQPEIDERNAAAKIVTDAQANLITLQGKYASMQSDIQTMKTQASSDAKAITDAANVYKAQVNSDIQTAVDVITTKKTALDKASKDLIAAQTQLAIDQKAVKDRETAVASRENNVSKIEVAQKNLLAVAGQTAGN